MKKIAIFTTILSLFFCTTYKTNAFAEENVSENTEEKIQKTNQNFSKDQTTTCDGQDIKMIVSEKINIISDNTEIPITIENRCKEDVEIKIYSHSFSDSVIYEKESIQTINKETNSTVFINAKAKKNGKSAVFFTLINTELGINDTKEVTIFVATQIGKAGTIGVLFLLGFLVVGGAYRTYKKHVKKAKKIKK